MRSRRCSLAALRAGLSLLALLGSLVLLVPPASAAPVVWHRVAARFAVGALSVHDDALTTYSFTGPRLELSGLYALMVDRNMLDLTIELGVGPLWTRAGAPALDLQHGAALTYGRSIQLSSPHELWLGAYARFELAPISRTV